MSRNTRLRGVTATPHRSTSATNSDWLAKVAPSRSPALWAKNRSRRLAHSRGSSSFSAPAVAFRGLANGFFSPAAICPARRCENSLFAM